MEKIKIPLKRIGSIELTIIAEEVYDRFEDRCKSMAEETGGYEERDVINHALESLYIFEQTTGMDIYTWLEQNKGEEWKEWAKNFLK